MGVNRCAHASARLLLFCCAQVRNVPMSSFGGKKAVEGAAVANPGSFGLCMADAPGVGGQPLRLGWGQHHLVARWREVANCAG